MIEAGIIKCLRGVPGLTGGGCLADLIYIFHGENDFLFELNTSESLKPTVIVPKKDVISIDMLFPDNLEEMCSKMINDTVSGEILFGSAHLFMDGVWYGGKAKRAAVKRILWVAYKGKIEDSGKTIYMTATKGHCAKMYKELQEAWKAPPEHYRNYPGGGSEESTYRYMGEY